MTSKEFVLWLKGFSEGVHEFNITPKQWDILKDKLAEVKDDNTSSPFPFGVPNTAPIQTLPFIQPYNPNPYKPYEVYCGDINGTKLTTTPGTGYITTYNPVQFGSGSFSTTTSTAKFPISGSNVTYTSYQPYTTGGEDEVIKKEKED